MKTTGKSMLKYASVVLLIYLYGIADNMLIRFVEFEMFCYCLYMFGLLLYRDTEAKTLVDFLKILLSICCISFGFTVGLLVVVIALFNL